MNENEKVKFRTSIGGQALIEGIMMRGPKKQAVAVRTKDGIVTKTEELKLIKDKYPILGLPIIRGSVNFIDTMVKGVKALMYSAEFFTDEDGEQLEESKTDEWIRNHFGEKTAEKLIIGFAVALGVGLSILLFMLLPTVIAGLFTGLVTSNILRNLIEGAIRIAIFMIYMISVSQMSDIKRVWRYHGAEHKTIFCYEKGLELTVENARIQPRHHPRCGTSFMLIVMIISILVFAVVKWSNVFVRMALRLLLLPVVVGISYEIIKLAGRYDNWLTRAISAPGKAMQNFTTAEPDDSMLEVAIEALKLVIPDEEGSDRW